MSVPAVAAASSRRVPSVSVSERVVSVHSRVPARVQNRRQLVFLDLGSHRLRWRQLTHGYQRVQRFTVSAPVAVVRLGAHALRGRDGRWLSGRTVRVARRAPVVAAPVAPVGPAALPAPPQIQTAVPPATGQSPAPTAPPATPVIPKPPASAPAPAPGAEDTPVLPGPPIDSPLPLVTPASASAFTDSVGVNVHMSYFSTPYNDWQQVIAKLQELGVHHVRDAACVGCTAQRQRLLALAAGGIGVDFMMGSPGGTTGSLPDLVSMIAGPMRSAVDAVEGPNEFDQSGDASWAADLRSYQQQLYSLMKSTPGVAGVPVIGPSLVKASSFAALGDLSSAMDWGNIHPYAGGQLPAVNLSFNTGSEAAVAASERAVATEAGYHNALSATSGQPPVSEAAAGDYTPRLVLDMFQAGVPRTYIYELLDEKPDPGQTNAESEFGLLRNDFSEKPAFVNLAALMHLTAATGSFDAAPLHVAVDGSPDLQQLLLQTGPHSYALVLWRDVKVWDQAARAPIDVQPADEDVQLGPEVTHAELSYLDDGGTTQTLPGTSAEVALSGMPVVLTLHT
ncbi:MAG TPA: hypothetical protein VGF74_09645 [Thermoleophilaceae bacterium]